MSRDKHVVLETIRQHGKTRSLIQCPYCNTQMWAYHRSLSGSGKKCSGCKSIMTFFGAIDRREK